MYLHWTAAAIRATKPVRDFTANPMLENPVFAETHAFREAFLARRAAGFLVIMPSSPDGPGSAMAIPHVSLGEVLLVFELVEQADEVAASYGSEASFASRVTVFDQIAKVVARGDRGTLVQAFLVDRHDVLAPLSAHWPPPPADERAPTPRPTKPRRRS